MEADIGPTCSSSLWVATLSPSPASRESCSILGLVRLDTTSQAEQPHEAKREANEPSACVRACVARPPKVHFLIILNPSLNPRS